MFRVRTWWKDPLLLLVASTVVALAGCHSNTQPGRQAAMPMGSEEPASPLKPAQEADVEIAMGRVAERRNDPDQAIAAYTEALKHDKTRADAYLRLAVLHDRRGLAREASAYYKQALHADPGNPEIFCDMGYSLYLQGRWTEAEMNLRQALAVRPEMPRAHNNLGLVLAQNQQVPAALAEFRRGGCNPAAAHENVAYVLSKNRRFDQAREQYRLALISDPSSEKSRDRLSELTVLITKLAPGDLPPLPDAGIMRTSNLGPSVQPR